MGKPVSVNHQIRGSTVYVEMLLDKKDYVTHSFRHFISMYNPIIQLCLFSSQHFPGQHAAKKKSRRKKVKHADSSFFISINLLGAFIPHSLTAPGNNICPLEFIEISWSSTRCLLHQQIVTDFRKIETTKVINFESCWD